jgi:Flp pilus assembly pilin Flp
MMGRLRDTRGAAAVETAFLVALVLIPLVIGTVEFGFALRDWLSVSSATREGARVGSAAGDHVDADCTILEATAGSLSAVENDQVEQVHIYLSDSNGSMGASQIYRPALPTDAPGSLFCGTWFPIQTAWPSSVRDNQGAVRDWLGVRVAFEHDWITNLLWFSGSATWADDAVMRLEPDIDS